MSDYKHRLDNALVQLQYIIDEQFEDNETVQDAFNNLAIILDGEYEE
jgi:hypothetical protein